MSYYGRGGGHRRRQHQNGDGNHPRRHQHGGSSYGRGGHGGGNTWRNQQEVENLVGGNQGIREEQELTNILKRIDGKQFGAYKDLYGSFRLDQGRMVLTFDKIQADPYASPSRVHVHVTKENHRFPEWAWKTEDNNNNKTRRIAFCDYLSRAVATISKSLGADQKATSSRWGGAKGGDIVIDAPSQHVMERTSVVLDPQDGTIEARFMVGLPARGRTILGEWAHEILTSMIVKIISRSLYYSAVEPFHLKQHLDSVEDQEHLRNLIESQGLVGFVANGAILPRASGASDEPMDASKAVPFQSPKTLECSFTLPNRGEISGMAIRKGVTLIVGGGFHGKTTLLQALEKGIYNHIPGDGREFVTMSARSVKIRAEDGRSVSGVNISPFIRNLPFGRDTASFSTPDASGSTSQAANIMEAIESGMDTLIIDEDTCATNFMIRDARMMALVSNTKEPITPFIDRVRELYEVNGISSVLVIGGCGDYFTVADTVVMMDAYVPLDVTARAKEIVQQAPGSRSSSSSELSSLAPENEPLFAPSRRIPTHIISSNPSGGGDRNGTKFVARRLDVLQINDEDVNLGGVEQLVELSQVRAIADILQWCLQNRIINGSNPITTILDVIESEIDSSTLDAIASQTHSGTLVRPRRHEIAAALNRIRSMGIQTSG